MRITLSLLYIRRELHIMNAEINEDAWSHTSLLWMVMVIWFCSNVLSQAVFMGVNGQPYGSELLLEGLGDWYWILVGLELLVYGIMGGYFFKKIAKFVK